jgi:hypothetical protein
MDFVDSATGTEQRGHNATTRGEMEAQSGLANMRGGAPPVGTAPNTATTNTTAPTATSTAPAATAGSTGSAVPPGSSVGY